MCRRVMSMYTSGQFDSDGDFETDMQDRCSSPDCAFYQFCIIQGTLEVRACGARVS